MEACLDFCPHPIVDFCSKIGKKDESSGFMDFVDKFLLLQNVPIINKFRLECGRGYYNSNRLKSWICTAVKHNVKELDVRLGTTDVVLELTGSLHLCSLEFLDNGNLLSGCPILEELNITRFAADNIRTLCIRSSTLKTLYIDNLSGFNVWYGVVIKTPALEVLNLRNILVEANFSILTCDYSDYKGCDHFCNECSVVLKVIIKAPSYDVPLFHNLIHFHLSEIGDNPWSILPYLIGHMPNLNVLDFAKNWQRCKDCSWHGAPRIVPECLSVIPNTIEFSGLSGCVDEMKLIRYLLKNAMVLKKLTLTSWTRSKKLKTNILKSSRSSTCQTKLSVEEWL